jgi:hypothetical protein
MWITPVIAAVEKPKHELASIWNRQQVTPA